MRVITVFIVDDHDVVRLGLRALLDQTEDLRVIGEAADGAGALRALESEQPDVVLMDIIMPEMGGSQVTEEIVRRWPEVRVIALSGTDAGSRIIAALHAGALGYVSKSATRAELAIAIRQVMAGRASMPVEMTRQLLRRLEPQSTRESLSARELEILLHLARGLGNREIGETLHISPATVRTHVSSILAKIGASNRVEATLFALRDGLLTLDECLKSPP